MRLASSDRSTSPFSSRERMICRLSRSSPSSSSLAVMASFRCPLEVGGGFVLLILGPGAPEQGLGELLDGEQVCGRNADQLFQHQRRHWLCEVLDQVDRRGWLGQK